MYACGLPIGMLVDKKGPRPAVLLGSIMLALGYFPLYLAYNAGSGSVLFMCLFSFMTGLGGCTAFAAAIKTSALNWSVVLWVLAKLKRLGTDKRLGHTIEARRQPSLWLRSG